MKMGFKQVLKNITVTGLIVTAGAGGYFLRPIIQPESKPESTQTNAPYNVEIFERNYEGDLRNISSSMNGELLEVEKSRQEKIRALYNIRDQEEDKLFETYNNTRRTLRTGDN